MQNAQSLTIGSTISGRHINWNQDVHYYRVNIHTQGKLLINLNNDIDTRRQVSVYNSRGVLIDELQTINGSTALGDIQLQTGVTTGDYYIAVKYLSGSFSTSYTLKTSLEETDYYEHEPNDTIATANPIVLDKTYSGISTYYKDRNDYFTFSTDQDGLIAINVKNKALYRWKVTLFDSKGNTIHNISTNNNSSATGDSVLSVGLPKGDYYVQISSNELYYSPYYFNVTLNTTINTELENNDSMATATHMTLNETFIGQHTNYYQDENDYFRFDLPKDTYTFIRLKNREDAQWTIELYNHEGTLIDIKRGNRPSYIKEPYTELKHQLKKGTYYINVKSYYNSTGINYELSANINTVTRFKDVQITHPNYKEISVIRELGIITGYNDNTFRPNELIKRRHLAAMIIRSGANLHEDKSNTYFKDVPTAHPNYDDILAIYRAGIIDGTFINSQRYFKPEANVTRAHLAKIIVNAYQLDENKAKVIQFKDINKQDWYYPYAKILASHGITLDNANTFKPNQPVSRADFAVLIERTLRAIN